MNRPGDFSPVFIGVSPAGVEWIAYRPEAVEPMKRRFTELTRRAEARALPAAQARYAAARRRVFRLKATANRPANVRRYGSTWNFPGYAAASDELKAARLALRKLEKKIERVSRG